MTKTSRSDVKSKASDMLLECYSKKGYRKFCSECNEVLDSIEQGKSTFEDIHRLKGELGEMYLLITLKELQKAMKCKSIIKKELYVRSSTTNKVTEIDVLFATPYKIYIFECKSYGGKSKIVYDKCTLKTSNITTDVYSQNLMHTALFHEMYHSAMSGGTKPYKMVVFDYSTRGFKDNRLEEHKVMIPICSKDNILEFMIKDLSKHEKSIINVTKLESMINIDSRNSEVNRQEHRHQLKY